VETMYIDGAEINRYLYRAAYYKPPVLLPPRRIIPANTYIAYIGTDRPATHSPVLAYNLTTLYKLLQPAIRRLTSSTVVSLLYYIPIRRYPGHLM